MKKRQTKEAPKFRSGMAVAARLRNGAGNHGDQKKQNRKTACRGRVDWR